MKEKLVAEELSQFGKPDNIDYEYENTDPPKRNR